MKLSDNSSTMISMMTLKGRQWIYFMCSHKINRFFITTFKNFTTYKNPISFSRREAIQNCKYNFIQNLVNGSHKFNVSQDVLNICYPSFHVPWLRRTTPRSTSPLCYAVERYDILLRR